jgi:hypothetical protein
MKTRVVTLGAALLWIGGAQTGAPLVLRRISEPRENAFSMRVPAGWVTEGGILRVDPTTACAAHASRRRGRWIC